MQTDPVSESVDMPDHDDLLDLIGCLYDAGANEAHWPDALRRLSGFFDHSAVLILTMDHVTGSIPRTVSYDLPPEGVQAYVSRYALVDPLARYAIANPETRCMDDFACIDESGIERSEFYTWLQRNMGCRYRLKTKLFHHGALHTYAVLKRTRKQGPLGEDAARLLLRVAPHLGRAVQIGLRLGDLSARQAALGDIADQLPYGIVFLDSDGRLILSNRVAEAVIADADGLITDRGRLQAQLPQIDRALQSALRAAVGTALGEGTDSGGILAIPRASGKRPYNLLISPLKPASPLLAPEHPHAAVFISDAERTRHTPAKRLSQTFGLTAKEAEIAVLLAAGDTVDQVAERLEIARSTTRLHLERIFKKTGVRRQVELVRLLLSSPVFLN